MNENGLQRGGGLMASQNGKGFGFLFEMGCG
nr:MAG TPA: hypothetical protein [Caudoviricetes sp.]